MILRFDSNDEDDDVQTIEEVILEGSMKNLWQFENTKLKKLKWILGPASLEHKLRMMQKQLLGMTDIPVQIQSKIAMVTKALEQFMTMDPDTLESSWQRASTEREELSSEKQFSSIPEENEEEDIESEGNNNGENSESFDHFEMEHSTRETSFSLDDLEEQYKKIQDNDETTDAEKSIYDDDEKSICESVKSEEMLKLEAEKKKKNEKILKLEKSWQKLCSNTKTIHK